MLLESEPSWRVELLSGEHGGRLSHARLLQGSIVGCWFGLERATGRRIWQAEGCPADDIFGVAGVVVVGTRVSGSGAALETRGIWGLSAETGRLLWKWPPSGPMERLSAGFRRLAGMRAEPADGPLLLQGGRVYTRLRRMLDCRTGLAVDGPVSAPEEAPGDPDQELTTELFFLRSVELGSSGARVLRQFDSKDPAEHLKHERCSHPEPVPFNYGAMDARGRVIWERRYGAGRRPVTNFFGCRFLRGRLLVVELTPTPELVVLDPLTGAPEQVIALPGQAACIQAADHHGVLLGLGATVSASVTGLAYLGVVSSE
ncbi:MAG: hypothetical protein HYY25_00030 [Candidatus Wallbacteria bacterium]|nr:hypothetical protein [Candidatus Wallbacteria bacterium]